MQPRIAPEQSTNQVNSQYEHILQFVDSEAGQVALGGLVGLNFKQEHETLSKVCLATGPACRELNTAKWSQWDTDTGAISQGLIEAVTGIWLLMRGKLRENKKDKKAISHYDM